MKCIIIAAGRGQRMGHMTDDLPKCLAIELNGKTLIRRQLEALARCDVRDLVIIRGYQSHKIKIPNIRYYENTDFANNNILESLFCAQTELDENVIVSYSDIWYEDNCLIKLLESKHDISICVDTNWRDHYVGRKDHPIDQAEMVIFDSNHNVVKIGKMGLETEAVHGEFVGLMKLTKKGCRTLKHYYSNAKNLYEGKAYGRANDFKKAYLTDLLQDMADDGVQIQCQTIESGWKEIDTIEDYQNAAKAFRARND